MDENRFIKQDVPVKGFGNSAFIITDTQTGVQYLFAASGYGGGLTALIDENGKPLLDPQYYREKL